MERQSDPIDLSRTFFQLDLGFKTTENASLTAGSNNVGMMTSPANNIAHTLFKQINFNFPTRGQAAVPQMTPKREPVTPARIKNEPFTLPKQGTSKIPVLTPPPQKIQKRKRKLPVPTPQKHRTELERLKEFGNWEP